MEEEIRDKKYFLEQYVLNQVYITPSPNIRDIVSEANLAWNEIQTILKQDNKD